MRYCDKKSVTVNVTNKCNMKCVYCMASSSCEQSNPKFISLEFARCGIQDALRGYPTGHKATSLRFFSPGEPTQNMRAIKECVRYAREIDPEIIVELQTNGLFNHEKDTEWIGKNIDIVWVSHDGPKNVSQKYRPATISGLEKVDEIENNIRILQKFTFVGVRATIVEETVDHQEELVEYFYNLGIDYLYVNPIIESITRKERVNSGRITEISLINFAKEFVKGYKMGIKLGVFYGSSLSFNFDEETTVACRSCIPMPQLNHDGSVSSCDTAMYKDAPPALQCFLYGQWDRYNRRIIYDQDKIKYLQNRKLGNLEKCDKCTVKDFCAGGCAGRVALEKGNIFETIPEYCAAIHYLAKNMNLGTRTLLFTHP